MAKPYVVCKNCGAHLDRCEKCDCEDSEEGGKEKSESGKKEDVRSENPDIFNEE